MKRILFQGDSITDAHRLRDNDQFSGNGYPTFIKGRLGYQYPGEYECLNRGISGDRVVDLYARIKRDTINLAPDIVSVLIGINDVWHEINYSNGVDAQKFEFVYGLLLDEIKAALPNAALVVMEPFVLEGAATCDDAEHPDRLETFRRETALRQQAARRVSETRGALFVPLQAAFDEAVKKAPPCHWLMDGVHPTAAGHELIAVEWLKRMGL